MHSSVIPTPSSSGTCYGAQRQSNACSTGANSAARRSRVPLRDHQHSSPHLAANISVQKHSSEQEDKTHKQNILGSISTKRFYHHNVPLNLRYKNCYCSLGFFSETKHYESAQITARSPRSHPRNCTNWSHLQLLEYFRPHLSQNTAFCLKDGTQCEITHNKF